ncbi:MAG: hypothetical protein KY476_04160 [Planctomycetes bacterium]|nr:hypothetical protein [Planctomycetota bacterium]
METAVRIAGTLGLILLAAALGAAWRTCRLMTLRTAWWCALGATAVWAAVWTASELVQVLRGGWAGLAWYLAAVLMLTPSLAVLGARRPVAAVWPWFVLLPLVLVLSLPAVAVIRTNLGDDPATFETFELEAPAAAGFLLVLLMGAGNYAGTRWTVPVVLYAAACGLLVFERAGWLASGSAPQRATLCLGGSAAALWWAASRRRFARDGLDRLWADFRDTFGIVWARRAADRINEALLARELPLRMGIEGLYEFSTESVDEALIEESRAQAEQTLRWLLKRFVDPAWIAERSVHRDT